MASDIIYSVKMQKGIKKWGIDYFKDSVVTLCQPEVLNSLAFGYRYYISKYIPKKSGTLRKSGHPVYKVGGERDAGGNGTGSVNIYWGDRGKSQKYAHYQFVGDVYGPNRARFYKNGKQKDWRSPKGVKKTNTGRKMGIPFTKTLYGGRVVTVKGYTTPGTGYDWIKRFHEDKGDFGETAVNIRAARYLYEASLVKSHIKGSRHIYNSWNQIKHRIP